MLPLASSGRALSADAAMRLARAKDTLVFKALQSDGVLEADREFGIFTAAALALAGGVVAAKASGLGLLRMDIAAGVSLGFALAGISALARYLVPPMSPLWGNLGAASTFLPLLTAVLSPLT